MKVLRSSFFRICFTLMAGLAFLNLSFVLAEMRIFDFSTDHPLFISMSNLGEEEQGTEGGETGEEDPFKEVDLSVEHMMLHQRLICEINAMRGLGHDNQSVNPGFVNRFSPPPEFL